MPAASQAAEPHRPPAAPGGFLDAQALGALAHLRFATRHQIDGTYSGRHRSRQQGGAAEFADYREYVEGEDLRRLDWKVLARTGRAYVRLFQDETNLRCTLAVDASGSMAFAGRGGRSKLEYVQWLATAFAHVIARQQDQVGLAVISDGLADLRAPGGRGAHLLGIQETIEGLRTKPKTDLAGGLREVFTRVPRRGVLLVMSDFLVDDPEVVFASLRLFRHRRWEVILLHIIHPEEERLPGGAAYRFEGLEGEGRIDASPADVRRLYEEAFATYCARVRDLALASGCEYRRVSTATPYLETVGGFLVERAG